MLRAALLALGLLLPSVADAQSLRLKNYVSPGSDHDRGLNNIYLAGAIDALVAYNMAAPVKLFCKESGVVDHEDAARLLSDWAKKQTALPDDTLIVIPLVVLLKKTYPCH